MVTDAPVHPHLTKPLWVRLLLARPRLLFCVVIGLATVAYLPLEWAHQSVTRAIIGWNVGAVLYLVLAGKMMFWSTHARMRTRALQHDEGRTVVLILVVMAALMSIGAIVAELAVVKDLKGDIRYAHIALAAMTIVTSWAFTQLISALHYAHDYYPVSYPHLDVYKRQRLMSASTVQRSGSWLRKPVLKFCHRPCCLLYTSRCV